MWNSVSERAACALIEKYDPFLAKNELSTCERRVRSRWIFKQPNNWMAPASRAPKKEKFNKVTEQRWCKIISNECETENTKWRMCGWAFLCSLFWKNIWLAYSFYQNQRNGLRTKEMFVKHLKKEDCVFPWKFSDAKKLPQHAQPEAERLKSNENQPPSAGNSPLWLSGLWLNWTRSQIRSINHLWLIFFSRRHSMLSIRPVTPFVGAFIVTKPKNNSMIFQQCFSLFSFFFWLIPPL